MRRFSKTPIKDLHVNKLATPPSKPYPVFLSDGRIAHCHPTEDQAPNTQYTSAAICKEHPVREQKKHRK